MVIADDDTLKATAPIHLTSDQKSRMVTLIDVVYILLLLPAGIMVDQIGRKLSVYLTVPIMSAGWILILTTRQNILNVIPIGKDCTVSVSRNVITEIMQHSDTMTVPYGLPFVNRCSLGGFPASKNYD
ncbi:uncharacterized protein LOC126550182 [Aphis gossypii]|uniref:uncharacterized protein LOC126550182 n=1 Tax=Aphis gossypii TaxID=80765 RepID=UPI002158FD35|nr:uncharacterized protein LOC126550182 [Aphis gossypii]